jgi:dimethylaniline monooxygenase (N-oxide forming)
VADAALTLNITRFILFATTWFPNLLNWLLDKAMGAASKAAFPNIPKSWNFSPAPSIATTTPLIADEIYALLESGKCEPVAAVAKITAPRTIELKDGRVLDDIDAIIYTTGYDLSAPFVEERHNPYVTPGAPPRLYRGTFPLHEDEKVRNSLVFLGNAGIHFPGYVQHELIIMAVSQIWTGKSSLPPLAEMQEWYRGFIEWRQERLKGQKSEATFYTITQPFTDHMRWMDTAAGTDVWSHFGWFSRKAWSFWWNNRRLYSLCANGLFSPAIWRLFESGKRIAWSKASEQIVLDNEAARAQVQSRCEKMKLARNKKTV